MVFLFIYKDPIVQHWKRHSCLVYSFLYLLYKLEEKNNRDYITYLYNKNITITIRSIVCHTSFKLNPYSNLQQNCKISGWDRGLDKI